MNVYYGKYIISIFMPLILPEPKILTPNSLIWNPLLQPDGPLIKVEQLRRYFLIKTELAFDWLSPDLVRYSCDPWLSVIYEPFQEYEWRRDESFIWTSFGDCDVRSYSITNDYELNIYDSSLRELEGEWLINTVSYREVCINILNTIHQSVDEESSEDVSFVEYMWEQIEEIQAKIRTAWYSNEQVFQLSEDADGKLLIFPKGYIHGSTPSSLSELWRKLFGDVLWWIGSWSDLVPA